MHSTFRLRFGDFVLDSGQQCLLRGDGTAVEMPPRQFLALQLFAERAGELIGKEVLLASLWPGAVVEENNLSQLVSSLRQLLGDSAKGSRYIQTVPRRGFRFVAQVEPTSDSSARPTSAPRLAVLPFLPLDAGGSDPVLEAGMADSLIARLSNLPRLAVLSIGSVRRFAGPERDPVQAARSLQADWVIDASLQHHGGMLRVGARLLRAADGVAAWSDSVVAQSTDLFVLQDRVAEHVALALAPALRTGLDALPSVAEVGGTRSIEAYRWYLLGAAKMLLQRGDELHASIECFRRALEADPGYARALVGLADAHRRASFVGELDPALAWAEGKAAIGRALALAPELGAAYSTLAYLQVAFEFDWHAAERAFRRSLELNSSLASGHFGLGHLLLLLSGADEGFAHVRRACELDPLQPLYGALEASFLRVAGRREEARMRLERTLQMAPGMPLAHLVRAQALIEDGDHQAGITALRQAVAQSGGATVFDGLLGYYLAQLGQRDEARSILAALRAKSRQRHVGATAMAAVHAGLGESDAALDALEQAVEQRDSRVGFAKDAPYWAALRSHPRFRALLGRIGLVDVGPGLWNP